MRRVLSSSGGMRKAFFLSLLAHAAIFGGAGPLARAARAGTPALAEPVDRWAGTTAELPFAGAIYDVSIDGPAKAAPAAPAPAEKPAEASPVKDPAPAEKPAEASPVKDPAPAVAAPPREAPRQAPRPAQTSHVKDPAPAASAAADRPASAPRAARRSKPKDDGEAAGGGAGGTFGAEGAGSVRDLGRAFTRAIPPSCDADPVWATLPIGAVGKVEVAITIDEAGHITSAEPLRADAPRALVNVVRRTVPMLSAGTFAVRSGSISAGVEILELGAVVSEKPTEDRLAWEYERGRGKARLLAQAAGRLVEVSVRVVRVEVR